MPPDAPASPAPPPPTKLYFGYGSNMWLSQMHSRCPSSPYAGVARLKGWKWMINERGYANVVPCSSSSSSSSSEGSEGEEEVWGLAWRLTAEDEDRLDVNEGVPEAYTKETMEVEFWDAGGEEQWVDVEERSESREMLVFVDRLRLEDDEPKKEYVYRMNRAMEDAVGMGVPKGYVEDVMRKFIPPDDGDGDEELERFAKRQAVDFKDEE